jgi:lysophospholipase L1-like esterase
MFTPSVVRTHQVLLATYNQETMLARLTLSLLTFALLAGYGHAVSSSRAEASGPLTGYPHAMASLGDSITRGYDADPGTFGEQLENVWSTGTSASVNSIYSRLLVVDPAISGHRFNDAVSGARMTDLNGQAQNAVSQAADLVLIFMGGNDVCTSTEASMTPVATFQAQFEQAMQTLATGLPDSRIALVSIPDVYNLWAILKDNASARFVWSFASICQSLLANPLSTAPADVQRRADVRQHNMDFNDVLNNVCAEYVHCRFDNYLAFNTIFTPSDVSTIDYFHPSVAGQANIAAQGWANSFDLTDVTPPVSDSSATGQVTSATVSLTATDNAGVSGIEYKVGAAAYQRYSSPVSIPWHTAVTWRAVDTNGNSEATHTCQIGGWAFPHGDSDCDGWADSVPAMGNASESFLGTDAARPCASTHFQSDEAGPDAWPADFDDNQAVNLTDVFMVVPHLNTADNAPGSSQRFDLTGDGAINLTDIFKLVPFLNVSCAP